MQFSLSYEVVKLKFLTLHGPVDPSSCHELRQFTERQHLCNPRDLPVYDANNKFKLNCDLCHDTDWNYKENMT